MALLAVVIAAISIWWIGQTLKEGRQLKIVKDEEH